MSTDLLGALPHSGQSSTKLHGLEYAHAIIMREHFQLIVRLRDIDPQILCMDMLDCVGDDLLYAPK